MNIYFYKGKNLSGKEIKGLYMAKSKTDVATMIKKNGFFVVNIKNSISGSFISLIKSYLIQFGDIAIFCQQLSILLNAGIPIIEGLDILKDQTRNIWLREAIYGFKMQIKNGRTLSEACESYPGVFPKFFNQMVKVGETTGDLHIVLKKLSNHYNKLKEQKEKIKSSLTYPCILVIVAILVFYFISVNVLPVFLNIFEQAGIMLPFSTRLLIFLCKNIKKLFLFVVIGFIILSCIFLKIKQTNLDFYYFKVKLSIPILGTLHKQISARNFLNNMYMLQSSGVSLLKSLKICKNVSENKVYKQEIIKIIEGIKLGRHLSEVMDKNLFPQIAIKMISIGEETGNLEKMLNTSRIYCEWKVTLTLERLLILIEPFIIFVIAIIIGFMVVAIMLPMFDIYNIF